MADGRHIGIEYLNVYGGRAYVDVGDIFAARGLDAARYDNLMMRRKTVGLPCEDPVSNAVNAAKPVLDRLGEDRRDCVELLITATESGLDFGKSLATYVHKYLGLRNACRVFEVKQACYGGTAALQMAAGMAAAGLSPRGKALIIATDVARPSVKLTYAEPSQGVAAVALLVGREPGVLDLDPGANGIHAFEVLDTCRPDGETETGDPDLSLMCYLDCLEASFADYEAKVEGADFRTSFDYLAFHTPFAGMVKGAHRHLMRRHYKARPPEIQEDFERRLTPSLRYCVEVGNSYSATVFVALAGLIDTVGARDPYRVGLFSYGSGCCAEFFSGIVPAGAAERQAGFDIGTRLAQRVRLPMEQYDRMLALNAEWRFGLRDKTVERSAFADLYQHCFAERGLLVLTGIEGYHRHYDWS
jgi:polyketide biosynthesis 3-hydroxy-3-methylglutaryl-CoA synthase-like enzyme PksG